MTNIMDPMEVFKATKSLTVPPTTTRFGGTHFPSVMPDPPKFEVAHEDGKRTLWVVFVIMVIASISFIGLAWPVPLSKRIYHVITTMITIIAALSYFAMATGTGFKFNFIIIREHHRHGVPDTLKTVIRQVYWARYVDWTLTTPLLLLDLFLLAGVSGANILIAILADLIMCLTGLFAAFGHEEHGAKWGWFAIACIAYLTIVWQVLIKGRAAARTKGSRVSNFFTAIAGYTLLVWTAYPVIWGIADGSRILSVDGEIIAYAVLDVLSKPIFGAWLLLTLARMPETNIDLGGFWTHGWSSEGRIRVGEDDEGA